MKLVIFGLTVSSSWGNGHATLWRGLCAALGRRGHRVVFFERDVPYYAKHRDLLEIPAGRLQLYDSWLEVLPAARAELADADVGMITSYCPDAIVAADLLMESPAGLRVFYDLDAPVTLERLSSGEPVEYVGPSGYRDFDLVLSYTGGDALEEIRTRLGAHQVAPLYGSVDPSIHRPAPPVEEYASDLSYLGTYAADRQEALERLFLHPARRLPHRRFALGGSTYPSDFPWPENVWYLGHVDPSRHAAFYSSSRITLNVTRRAMARMGSCPSGRLFEAAACATAILTDGWRGLEDFFTPGSEILVARTAEEAISAVESDRSALAAIGRAARERTLGEHTADHRAVELESILERAWAGAFEIDSRGGAEGA